MIRTILNEKGGVAKTTTAIQLAAGFAKAGRKTLLIDGDPQGGATKILFAGEQLKSIMDSENTISRVMKHPESIRECIWNNGIDHLDIIPSNGSLNRTLNQLQLNPMTSYPGRLQKALRFLDDEYQQIIIDNNPFFSLFSMNTVVCADEVIIPSDIEYGSLNAIRATIEDISAVLQDMDEIKPLNCRILLTMIDRLKIDRAMIEQMRQLYGDRVYETTIRTQSKPVKIAGFAHDLLINDQKSGVAADYRNFIQEVIGGKDE